MTAAPPPPPLFAPADAQAEDRSQLRVLATLFWVFAGLQAICGLGSCGYGAFASWFFPRMIASMPQAPGATPPPTELFEMFGWIYGIAGALHGLLCGVQAVLAALAARAVAHPRSKGVCMAASILALISFPLGTALGVFALVVLMRPSVDRLFRSPGA